MGSVNCFLCDKEAFTFQVSSEYSGYMDVYPVLHPPKGGFFKVRPFDEYPAKDDASKPRPCVHFSRTELRRTAGRAAGDYHAMDFGWDLNQTIYVCSSCLWKEKNEPDVEFLQRLDKGLMDKLDKEVLCLLLNLVSDLRVFSFTNLRGMRRRFERLPEGDRGWLMEKFNNLYPIFVNADQKRAGKTRKWMEQLAKVVRVKKNKSSPIPA